MNIGKICIISVSIGAFITASLEAQYRRAAGRVASNVVTSCTVGSRGLFKRLKQRNTTIYTPKRSYNTNYRQVRSGNYTKKSNMPTFSQRSTLLIPRSSSYSIPAAMRLYSSSLDYSFPVHLDATTYKQIESLVPADDHPKAMEALNRLLANLDQALNSQLVQQKMEAYPISDILEHISAVIDSISKSSAFKGTQEQFERKLLKTVAVAYGPYLFIVVRNKILQNELVPAGIVNFLLLDGRFDKLILDDFIKAVVDYKKINFWARDIFDRFTTPYYHILPLYSNGNEYNNCKYAKEVVLNTPDLPFELRARLLRDLDKHLADMAQKQSSYKKEPISHKKEPVSIESKEKGEVPIEEDSGFTFAS